MTLFCSVNVHSLILISINCWYSYLPIKDQFLLVNRVKLVFLCHFCVFFFCLRWIWLTAVHSANAISHLSQSIFPPKVLPSPQSVNGFRSEHIFNDWKQPTFWQLVQHQSLTTPWRQRKLKAWAEKDRKWQSTIKNLDHNASVNNKQWFSQSIRVGNCCRLQ